MKEHPTFDELVAYAAKLQAEPDENFRNSLVTPEEARFGLFLLAVPLDHPDETIAERAYAVARAAAAEGRPKA